MRQPLSRHFSSFVGYRDTSTRTDNQKLKKTILALTLNEIDGVQAVLPMIDSSWYDQLIVVDGGSTDGTIEWCVAHGYEVYIQKRKGIRFAYLEVLPLVLGDVILCLSPDGNCPSEAIPRL